MSEKGKFGYIFIIWILIFIIAILFFLYFSGFLYASNKNQVSSLPLGTTSKIPLNKNSSFSLSFDIGGEVLPNEKLPQNINIYNESENDLYVRAKAYVFTKNGLVEMKLETSENWVLFDDYYYYNSKILGNETISLCTKILVSDKYNFTNKEKYIVNVLAESLDSSLDPVEIWNFEISNE